MKFKSAFFKTVSSTLLILIVGLGWHLWTLNDVELFMVKGTEPNFKNEVGKIAKYVTDNMSEKHNLKIVYPLRIIITPNNEEYKRVYQNWARSAYYEDDDLLGFLQEYLPKWYYRHNIVVVANESTKGLLLTHSVVHEMVHSFQFSLGHSLNNGAQSAWINQRLVKKLRWFTEGSCDVIAAKIVETYGFPEAEKTKYLEKTIKELKSKSLDKLPKLSQLNSVFWDKAPGDHSELYAIGRLAVMKLEARFGEEKIFQYFVELNNLKDVPKAFEKTFGIPLSQYEVTFDEELTALLK